MVESHGGILRYVKPHGALYNSAARDEKITSTILKALEEIDGDLIFMGLAGSVMEEIAQHQSRPFMAEAFADRCYESDGSLRRRSLPNAVITDPRKAAKQVLQIVLDQQVTCHDGSELTINAQSVCIHGDNLKAVEILRAIDASSRLIESKKWLTPPNNKYGDSSLW